MRRSYLRVVMLPGLISLAANLEASDFGITPVGLLDGQAPGGYSRAVAISPDGRVVVGDSMNSAGVAEPFLWSAATGMVDLGNPSGAASYATGVAVRPNGEIVVSGNIGSIGRRWSSTTGRWSALAPVTYCATTVGNALALSPGGEVWIAGTEDVRDARNEHVMWRGYRYQGNTGGWVGPEQGVGSYCEFSGIASNGAAVGWWKASLNAKPRAMYWSGQGPLECIPILDVTMGQANAISQDGRVVAGFTDMFGPIQPFRWRVGEQAYEILSVERGSQYSSALALSGDGSLVGGFTKADGSAGSADVAVIWDAHGEHNLMELLTRNGADLGGWVTLNKVRSISADGRTVCGEGMYDPDGAGPAPAVSMGFVAAVPEPSALIMLAVTAALTGYSRRQRRSA